MSDETPKANDPPAKGVGRRGLLLRGTMLSAAAALAAGTSVGAAKAQSTAAAVTPGAGSGKRPNILVIMADDIGWSNISAYNMGIMGYRTPNIDRIAKEGALFTDYYGEQSCMWTTGSSVDSSTARFQRALRRALRESVED
jgi:arylsulfatase